VTQGIVSIRKDGTMLYKIIVGHDGMNAPKVASRIRSLDHLPTVEDLKTICSEEDFGCPDCLIVLEHDPGHWNKPKLHAGKDIDWDVVEDKEKFNGDFDRYFDTFHVAEFNPRWRYGTAPYVEVVDLRSETARPDLQHWTDEEIADMKDKGIIKEG
jgi:hypothetical protein